MTTRTALGAIVFFFGCAVARAEDNPKRADDSPKIEIADRGDHVEIVALGMKAAEGAKAEPRGIWFDVALAAAPSAAARVLPANDRTIKRADLSLGDKPRLSILLHHDMKATDYVGNVVVEQSEAGLVVRVPRDPAQHPTTPDPSAKPLLPPVRPEELAEARRATGKEAAAEANADKPKAEKAAAAPAAELHSAKTERHQEEGAKVAAPAAMAAPETRAALEEKAAPAPKLAKPEAKAAPEVKAEVKAAAALAPLAAVHSAEVAAAHPALTPEPLALAEDRPLSLPRESSHTSLFAVLLLLSACGIAVLLLARRRRQATPPAQLLRVVSSCQLSPKVKVMLVSVGDRELLLSVGDHGAGVLARWRAGASGGDQSYIEVGEVEEVEEIARPSQRSDASRTTAAPREFEMPEIDIDMSEALPAARSTPSPAVAGLLKLRRHGSSEEVASGDPVADEEWARELLAAMRGSDVIRVHGAAR